MTFPMHLLQGRGCTRIVEPGRLHPAVSFARASTATYLGPSGLASAIANALRFEYDDTPNFLGLLIEEQRTNIMKSSDVDVTKYTVRSNVVNAGAPIAGFTNSVQFGDNSLQRYAYAGSSGAITPSSTYAVSVFVQMDDGAAPVPGINSDFSIVVGGAVSSTYTVTKVAGSIYRVSTVKQASSSTSSTGVLKNTTYTARTFRMTGLQIEAAGSVTSYIPTTTAAVTRSADVAQATSLSALGISTTAGTFVIEHDALVGAPLIYSGSNRILDAQGGTKVAIAYDATETRVSVDGSPALVGSPLTWSTTLDLLRSATAGANAHVKSLSYFPIKRADDELRQLSSALQLVLIGTYPAGTSGVAYSAALPIGGGIGGYSNPRVTAGSLPAGLSLSIVSDTLVLAGTATTGTATVTLAVDSADGQTAYTTQTITIGSSTTAWNPADKGTGITLSGGNFVATKASGTTYNSVRATNGKSTGKRMFRGQVISVGSLPSEILIGIAKSSASLSNFIGSSADAYAKDSQDNNVYSNNVSVQNAGFLLIPGDYCDVYVDFGASTVRFGKSGATPAAAITISAGTYFPAATVTRTTAPDAVGIDTANNTTWGTSNGYTLWDAP